MHSCENRTQEMEIVGPLAAFAESGLLQCAIDDRLPGLGIKFGKLPEVAWVQSLAL